MTIGIDFDQIMAELKRLAREAAAFPAANEVAVSEGGTSKATDELRNAVAYAAGRLSVATQNAVDSLNETQETIRQAVMMIAEQDAAIADDSKLILSLLDSAVAQSDSDTSAEADY
ncbi:MULTISPECIES: hypothetical protein [Microbacterium]|jgi:hypothetical protein|uniref:Uncharacterized protein n=1 Tax=Microbacterium paraoxydans TaxID=199592 RepID=A0ABZ2HR68_9MICO|nr:MULTISPECIES: hypothetical protein [Microbacterium]PJI54510.1 hypothetical protein CTI14_14695 [Methylobacterium radiotolerans]AMG83519.1 hypothetical protein AXH82_09115 [Microbacterium sp. PAMC 28756]MPT14775.1 hypothetical protein [Microbacterium sp.]OSP08973.1 hypothetical protein B7W94_04930 [Microbacterium sp. LEMMJ01]QXE30388.1 hypothetical protein IZR02_02405 [Microbacterium paraoxydans]